MSWDRAHLIASDLILRRGRYKAKGGTDLGLDSHGNHALFFGEVVKAVLMNTDIETIIPKNLKQMMVVFTNFMNAS